MAIDITHGENRTLSIQLVDSNGSPYALNSPSEIKARFQREDKSSTTYLEKTKTSGAIVITSDPNGQFTVTLGQADTAAIKKGKNQAFEIHLTVSGATRIVPISDALNVYAQVSELP